ncbi:MAG: carbon-nitrogen hydrolase family protein [Trueperaceae bacterium]
MRVATFQKPNSSDHVSVLPQIMEDLQYCDRENIDIVCFPECYLTGYYLEHAAIAAHALSLGGSEFDALLKTCSNFQPTDIIGLIEKSTEGFYNTAAVITKGKLLGYYRKTHPNEKHFMTGQDFPVFQHEGKNFGINICNDANYPEAARALANQGANILFFPLNNLLPKTIAETWHTKSPENLCRRATETKCWVVSSDVVGQREDWLSYGCTHIISPEGTVVASVVEEKEGFISFEIT